MGPQDGTPPDLRWATQPEGRGLWLAGAWVALMALLGVALWGWWLGVGGPGSPAPPKAAGPRAGAASATAATALPSASTVLALGAQAQAAADKARLLAVPAHWNKPMAAPTVTPASGAASAVRRTDTLSLCGLGPVRVSRLVSLEPSPADPAARLALPEELGDERLARLWPELVKTLKADARPRQQAAGWLLSGDEVPRDQVLAGLTRLAQTSGDAWVILRALQACIGRSDLGACQTVKARHAVRADPGNLVTWLGLLAEEPAALDEAFSGMAAARFADWGDRRLAAMAIEALPADQPAYLALVLEMQVTGIDAATPIWSNAPVVQACNQAKAAGDANRLAQCEAIAQVWAHASRDLMSRGIGGSMGKRLGWDPGRLAKLDHDLKAGLDALLTRRVSLTQPYACDALASTRAHRLGEAEQGEAAWWLHQAAKRPGLATAPLR